MRTAAFLLALLPGAEPVPSPDPPDRVLLVILDDVGLAEAVAAPTPNLDALAAAGRTYPVAWAAPMCSNTRAQLLSGRYPFRPDNRVGSNVREGGTYELPASPLLVPARITAAGLSASLLGKWHLAPAGRYDHPLRCGFSHAAGTEGNLVWAGDWDYFEWMKIVDGEGFVQTGYVTSDTVDDAITEVHHKTDLIVVALHAAHAPVHCPPPELAPQTPCDSDTRNKDRKVAMIEAADTEIGRLAATALPAGYTMIVTSDNGPGELGGGGKFTVYETGLRVPMIAVGPDVVPGESTARVSIVDLGPTILDLLGVEYESGWFDGQSFAEELAGGPATPRYLFAEMFVTGAPIGLFDRRAIRDERWKLHTGIGYPPDEFYDLLEDPGETQNLLESELTLEQSMALQNLRDHLPH